MDNHDSSDSETPSPWDRLPREPSRWYDRFDAFRLLGPARTVEQVYRAETNRQTAAPGEWKRQAARWRWRERAEAWDKKTRKERQEVRLAHLARLEEEHAALGLLCIEKAKARIEAVKADDLSPIEALRLLLAGAQLRREALNDPAVEEVERRVQEMERLIDQATQEKPK